MIASNAIRHRCDARWFLWWSQSHAGTPSIFNKLRAREVTGPIWGWRTFSSWMGVGMFLVTSTSVCDCIRGRSEQVESR